MGINRSAYILSDSHLACFATNQKCLWIYSHRNVVPSFEFAGSNLGRLITRLVDPRALHRSSLGDWMLGHLTKRPMAPNMFVSGHEQCLVRYASVGT